MLPAWEALLTSSKEEDTAWNFMYHALQFQPRVQQHRPGIVEPVPSLTYAIGHIYTVGETQARSLEDDLNQKTLAALQVCTSPAEKLYALDWQHTCYWFHPHRPFDADKAEAWGVPVLPNGDYYIFLVEDFRFGIFGHPWEQTLCIFGPSLLEAYSRSQPLLFTRLVRTDGKPNVAD